MKINGTGKLLVHLITAAVMSLLLLFSPACAIPTEDETEMLEDLLNRLDAVEGEITFVTEDGETVHIEVTKESTKDKQSQDDEEEPSEEKDKDSSELSDILPSLCSKEDVFKALGVWEEAHALIEQGLTWSHTAEELGYTAETMLAELDEMAERELHDAKAEGLINQDQLVSKLESFNGLARKWVGKIFADGATDTVDTYTDLASILPPPDSYEDVFEYLGVWEDARAFHEQGLTWSHTAEELEYNADKMYAELRALAERELHDAKVDGLISYEQYQSMLAEFSETAMDWVQEIFADAAEIQ